MSEILVISIGNTLRGDDGVGMAVIEQLRQMRSIPSGVELLECGMDDLSVILLRPKMSKLIVIDAANMGLAPGEWRRLSVGSPEFEFMEGRRIEHFHGLGLTQAISLGTALGILPDEIVIFAVQPEDIGYHQGLSAAIKKTVYEVCKAIQFELELTHTQKIQAPNGSIAQ